MKNNVKTIILVIIAGLVFIGVYRFYKKKQHIAVEHTESPVNMEKSPVNKVVVINVLDKNMYEDCHIKGSINVPFEDLEKYASTLDKNSEIVVYCSNYKCTASSSAAKILKKMGFNNVWAYEGGMAEWYQNQLPVEGECKESYLKEENVKAKGTEEVSDINIVTTQDLRNKLQ